VYTNRHQQVTSWQIALAENPTVERIYTMLAKTKLEGLTIRRKATGEVFTITGKDDSFFLLNGGADNGGRDVMGSELSFYERVGELPTPCVCNDTGWLETQSNGWVSRLFSDPRAAVAHAALKTSYKPCPQCAKMLNDKVPADFRSSLDPQVTKPPKPLRVA
jgi:hypothetical protein